MFSKIGTHNKQAQLMGADKVFATNQNTGVVTVTFTKADFAQGTADTYIGNVIELLDNAISNIDGQRAGLGALQNRLESSIRNQSTLLLTRLMHAHVFVMLILLKNLLTYHSSPLFSRQLLPC